MYTLSSTFLLLTLSVTLSAVQAYVPRPRQQQAPVCRDDSQLRALERYSSFADEFCPEFLAQTGGYPRWLDQWNKNKLFSACSCYEKTATAHGAPSTASITGTLALSSTAPAPLSSVFATTTASSSPLPSASGLGPSASVPLATESTAPHYSPSGFPSGSVTRGPYPFPSATGRYYPSGSPSGGYYPSGSASGGYYPSASSTGRLPSGSISRGLLSSGSAFGSSGFLSASTGSPIISSPASTSLPSVPNRGVSALSSNVSSLISASSTIASAPTSASLTLSQGASELASSTAPSGTSSLPAGDTYPPQPPGAGPGKRGLVYDGRTQDGWSSLFKSSKYVTYGSNGGLNRGTKLDKSFSFVPTLVVDADLNNAEWNTQVPVLIEGGTKALFASVDNSAQSKLTAEQAATVHQKYMQPYAGTVQLGTPPIANNDTETGLSYLEDFVGNCASCRFNFVDVRIYQERSNANVVQYAQALRDFLENDVVAVQAKHPQLKGLPIFLSGWWLNGASLDEGGDLMEKLLPYLDHKPEVLAHQATPGLLEGGLINADATGLTPAGQKYFNFIADVSSLFG